MTLPYRIVVRHDDRLGDYVEVEFLEPEHATFQEFINHDVFGRWGIERELEGARAVLAGTYSVNVDGVEQRLAVRDTSWNAHHVLMTPTATTITCEYSDEPPPSTTSTAEWAAFLEDFLTHIGD